MENPKDEFPVLMDRILEYRSKIDQNTISVIIKVGFPAWVKPNVEASCPLNISGMMNRSIYIRGVDPIDAMKNVVLFIDNYLTNTEDDKVFFWPNGDEY